MKSSLDKAFLFWMHFDARLVVCSSFQIKLSFKFKFGLLLKSALMKTPSTAKEHIGSILPYKGMEIIMTQIAAFNIFRNQL